MQKNFQQNSRAIYDKNSEQSDYRRSISQNYKICTWQTIANILSSSEKLKAFSLESGTRHETWHHFIQHSIGSPKQDKEKALQLGKGSMVTVCWKHELCVENPKDATKNLLEVISEINKLVGYKINILKSVVFLSTTNKLSEREIKKTIPFIIAFKKIT